MMKKFLCVALVGSLMCAVGASAQTTVTLELKSDVLNEYYIEATITGGDPNEGLALWGADVDFGVTTPLGQMNCPGGMTTFQVNDGLNNPAGYGGTLSGNILLQVGGAQNTINNPGPTPPYPVGAVVTGIGSPTEVVATGDCVGGTDVMDLTNCFANVIIGGETGPVYAVSAADVTCLGTAVDCKGDIPPVFQDSATDVGSYCDVVLSGSDSMYRDRGAVGGVYTVVFDFNASVSGTPTVQENTCQAGTCSYPSACTPTGWVATDTSPTGINLVCTGDTPAVGDLQCTFAPNQLTVYRFDFTSIDPGSSPFDIRILKGDVNNDGYTDGADSATVVGVWGGATPPGSGWTCGSDVYIEGSFQRTDGVDDGVITGVWGSTGNNCALMP